MVLNLKKKVSLQQTHTVCITAMVIITTQQKLEKFFYAPIVVHFYNYILNSWDKNHFPRTRFASEYGFQAMPQLETWLSATNNTEDLDPNSDFLQHRQHLPAGNSYLKLLIAYELKLPNENSSNYFEAFIFYTQVSIIIKTTESSM